MKITGVGIGSTNRFTVRRGQLGTRIGTGDTGDVITKVVGNYNIIDNAVLHFVELHMVVNLLVVLLIDQTKEIGLV